MTGFSRIKLISFSSSKRAFYGRFSCEGRCVEPRSRSGRQRPGSREVAASARRSGAALPAASFQAFSQRKIPLVKYKNKMLHIVCCHGCKEKENKGVFLGKGLALLLNLLRLLSWVKCRAVDRGDREGNNSLVSWFWLMRA